MSSEHPSEFLTGIIEGFYGRPWPFATRLAYASYLYEAGFNTCIYCPKADPYLRKQWQCHWPPGEWSQLLELSAAYSRRDIRWGVGLSPFELYRQYGTHQREQLRTKIARLGELGAPLLAILFDDMPGDLEDLASRQAEIVSDVVSWLPGVRVLVCPTYYSFDAVLERFFGRMPVDYWPRLGSELPSGVDIFWTGNRVCSELISAPDIERIHSQLQRPVLLWDNYPVNDGAVRSNFLYLERLSQRNCLPRELLSGHLCNPMNQGLLSLPALAGLAELYRPCTDTHWAEEAIGPATWRQIQANRREFQEQGLSGMGEARCRELANSYAALPGPAAREVSGWLLGEYRFDPACLTD
ncbi:MAG: beta-N-acetylglucosaminidase domain-containing protein [Halioglobus sp.]|nr:beta-N-acetylglucosaminidase domain-containing protein [Halioglobus sp.]